MCFDDKRERLLTGSAVFSCWPLARSVQDILQLPHTHERPLVAVEYNAAINQIATLCTESTLKVWEADSGKLVYVIGDVHGKGVEATCMAICASGYRLATAAVNNSIKIWDFGAGQELKHKRGRRTQETCISGIQYVKVGEENYVLTFGWNNKIKMFFDTNESNDLTLVKVFDDLYELPDNLTYLSKSKKSIELASMQTTYSLKTDTTKLSSLRPKLDSISSSATPMSKKNSISSAIDGQQVRHYIEK